MTTCAAPAVVAAPASPVFVPMSMLLLALFCVALFVHYLAVRREARMMRRSMSPYLEPEQEETKSATSTPATSPPPPAKLHVIPHKPPSSVYATAAP